MLTPLEIKKKQFEQKMRGADADEVQSFLDVVSLDMESLLAEKRQVEDKLIIVSERLEHFVSLEQTIEKTLAAALQTAVTMQEQARRDTELILREAEIEKTRKLNDARIEQERIE